MVIYELTCEVEHRFEGWFDSRTEFERQLREQLIECPLCGSQTLVERPVAPAVHGAKRTTQLAEAKAQEHQKAQSSMAVSSPTGKVTPLRALTRAIQQIVDEHFDDVGSDFAEEAIAIHFGDAEARNISGSMTSEDEEELDELGVPHAKLALPHFDD